MRSRSNPQVAVGAVWNGLVTQWIGIGRQERTRAIIMDVIAYIECIKQCSAYVEKVYAARVPCRRVLQRVRQPHHTIMCACRRCLTLLLTHPHPKSALLIALVECCIPVQSAFLLLFPSLIQPLLLICRRGAAASLPHSLACKISKC